MSASSSPPYSHYQTHVPTPLKHYHFQSQFAALKKKVFGSQNTAHASSTDEQYARPPVDVVVVGSNKKHRQTKRRKEQQHAPTTTSSSSLSLPVNVKPAAPTLYMSNLLQFTYHNAANKQSSSNSSNNNKLSYHHSLSLGQKYDGIQEEEEEEKYTDMSDDYDDDNYVDDDDDDMIQDTSSLSSEDSLVMMSTVEYPTSMTTTTSMLMTPTHISPPTLTLAHEGSSHTTALVVVSSSSSSPTTTSEERESSDDSDNDSESEEETAEGIIYDSYEQSVSEKRDHVRTQMELYNQYLFSHFEQSTSGKFRDMLTSCLKAEEIAIQINSFPIFVAQSIWGQAEARFKMGDCKLAKRLVQQLLFMCESNLAHATPTLGLNNEEENDKTKSNHATLSTISTPKASSVTTEQEQSQSVSPQHQQVGTSYGNNRVYAPLLLMEHEEGSVLSATDNPEPTQAMINQFYQIRLAAESLSKNLNTVTFFEGLLDYQIKLGEGWESHGLSLVPSPNVRNITNFLSDTVKQGVPAPHVNTLGKYESLNKNSWQNTYLLYHRKQLSA